MQRATSFLRPSVMPRGYAAGQPGQEAPIQVLHQTVFKSGLKIEISHTKPLYPGNPLELLITVKTSTPGSWNINLVGSCQLQYYTGTVVSNLGHMQENFLLEGEAGSHGKLAVLCGGLTVAAWRFTRAAP